MSQSVQGSGNIGYSVVAPGLGSEAQPDTPESAVAALCPPCSLQ